MADTDLEMMVAALSVDIRGLKRQLENASGDIDKHTRAMERRFAQMSRNINREISGIATKALGFGAGLLGIHGASDFVEGIIETAMNAKKQAAAIGVSTDAIQGWSIIAKKADVDQEQLNTSLERMVKNFERAKIETTAETKLLNKLFGTGWRNNSPEEMIYAIADAVKKTEPGMRAGIIGLLMGGGGGGQGGVALTQFFAQGGAAIKAQVKDLRDKNELIKPGDIEKIQQLDIAWTDLKAKLAVGGAAGIRGFVDEFDRLSKTVTGKDFESSLRTIGEILAKIVAMLPTLAKYAPLMASFYGGYKIGKWLGPEAGVAFGTVAAAASSQLTDGRPGADTEASSREMLTEWQDYLKRHPGNPTAIDNVDYFKSRVAQFVADRTPAKTPKEKPDSKGGGGGGDPFMDTPAFPRAVAALRERMADIRTATGEYADFTAAEQAATVKAELLRAAQEDADRAKLSVTANQHALINSLAAAYGRLAAMRGFAQDLRSEDERIAKLRLEGEVAGETAAKIAEAKSLQEQMDAFHKRFGEHAMPSTGQLADMHARAARAGGAEAASGIDQALANAQRSNEEFARKPLTIGLNPGAIAEAELRFSLLNEVTRVGADLNAKYGNSTLTLGEKIDGLAKRFGELTQAESDANQTAQDAVAEADAVRSGIENIGAAGARGFKSMKAAAADFMMQLAELIIRLEIMQPLIEAAFGKKGTSFQGGGGFVTSLFKDIGDFLPHFATGTPSAPGGISLVGERGPELVNLPRGAQVFPAGQTRAMLTQGGGGVLLHAPTDITINGNADRDALAALQSMLADHRRAILVDVRAMTARDRIAKRGAWAD